MRSVSGTGGPASVPATRRSCLERGTASSSRARSPADSRLYLIVGARPDLDGLLEAAIRGGVDLVQIREKELPDRELLETLELARRVTARHSVPLVVNDRPA